MVYSQHYFSSCSAVSLNCSQTILEPGPVSAEQHRAVSWVGTHLTASLRTLQKEALHFLELLGPVSSELCALHPPHQVLGVKHDV